MAEPVTLEDIKRHLVLDPDDASEDAYLEGMIVAARRACELRTRRTIVAEEAELVLDTFPRHGAEIALPGGVVTGVTITYNDAGGAPIELDEDAYFVAFSRSPAVVRPVAGWPATDDRPGAVSIAYSLAAMDGSDLHLVKHAIRLIVGHWHANREAVAVDGRAGEAELPLAVSWLLAPLVKFAID